MLSAGTLVGNDFRVVRLLKEGGMGAVYLAEQVSLAEMRALKVMHAQIAGVDDPERLQKFRARFLEEARRSRGLRSAHVVKVVAAGIDAGIDAPWLAMELLQGEDLDATLRRRTHISWDETALLMEQVTHGLAAAHGAGVLHLDLKPENLFVSEPESPGVPFTMKVLDFGIGRLLEERRSAVTATTAIGTPLWMAPEQALKGQVSRATDLWALGLIAYRCLTGRHYWREANKPEEQFSAAGWIVEVMTGALDRASVRAAEQGVEECLPLGFDDWFARCVVRESDARWQHVEEMFLNFPLRWSGAGSASRSLPPAPPAHATAMSATVVSDLPPRAPTLSGVPPTMIGGPALSEPPPVWWTPQKARDCARSDPWRSTTRVARRPVPDGPSPLNSSRRRCASARSVTAL